MTIGLCIALVAAGGCATTGHDTLLIKTAEAASTQNLPEEFTRMLEALGYEWVPVTDPDIGHRVKVATVHGEYRMRFRARDAAGIQIDVHIRKDGGSAGLHFTQDGGETLDAGARRRYLQLRERLEFEFGDDNVVDNRPLLAP